jgi:hypothetical protein
MYVATRFQEIQKSRCSALKTAGFAFGMFRFYSSQLCQTFCLSQVFCEKPPELWLLNCSHLVDVHITTHRREAGIF